MSTILIVDPEQQELLKMILTEKEYTIYTAQSLITPHLTKNIDLIILDAGYLGSRIPECAQLQRFKEGRGIPIIITSVTKALATEAKKAGADAFLEKPFECAIFLSLVHRLLLE